MLYKKLPVIGTSIDWTTCGGSLIANDMVLTAAHCLMRDGEVSYVEIKIYFGTNVDMLTGCSHCRKKDYAKAKAYAKTVSIHTEYRDTGGYGSNYNHRVRMAPIQ